MALVPETAAESTLENTFSQYPTVDGFNKNGTNQESDVDCLAIEQGKEFPILEEIKKAIPKECFEKNLVARAFEKR